MKFQVTLMDAEGIHDALKSLAEARVAESGSVEGCDFRNQVNGQIEAIGSGIEKWVGPYRESITIEFDTDAGTARVCEVGE